MIQIITSLLIFFFSANSSWAQSPKKPRINAAIGPVVNQLDVNQDPWLQPRPLKRNNVGFFVGAEYILKNYLSVELDMIIANYQYMGRPEGTPLSELSTRLHFPILIRLNLGTQFSIGAGPFASYRMGDVKVLSGATESKTNATSAHNYGNHGFEGSFRFILPLGPQTHSAFILDYRHTYSVTPRAAEKSTHQNFIFAYRTRI